MYRAWREERQKKKAGFEIPKSSEVKIQSDLFGHTPTVPTAMKLRPEILCHPNIPKPLHGIAPRVIFGQGWWDVERKKCYEKAGQKCEACGTARADAWPNRWLEAHEEYEMDYGIFRFVGVVCLCPACHRFIHSGLRSVLVEARRMSRITNASIEMYCEDILKQNDLMDRWLARHDYYAPKWGDHRMLIDGKFYGPSSTDLNGWMDGEWKNWTVVETTNPRDL